MGLTERDDQLSLLEDMEYEEKVLKSVTAGCKVCRWLMTLDDRDRVIAKIDQWYEDGLPHLNLWKLLRKNGLDGSEAGLRRHRDNCAGRLADVN